MARNQHEQSTRARPLLDRPHDGADAAPFTTPSAPDPHRARSQVHPARGQKMFLTLGPAPSTHGVPRVVMKIDGERIVDIDPVLGYVHRGVEKDLRAWRFAPRHQQHRPLEYRPRSRESLPVLATSTAGAQGTVRVDWCRCCASSWIASTTTPSSSARLAAKSARPPILYGFGERDKIDEILSTLAGQKLFFNYMRIEAIDNLDHQFLSRLATGCGRRRCPRRRSGRAFMNESGTLRQPAQGAGRDRPRDGLAPRHVRSPCEPRCAL